MEGFPRFRETVNQAKRARNSGFCGHCCRKMVYAGLSSDLGDGHKRFTIIENY